MQRFLFLFCFPLLTFACSLQDTDVSGVKDELNGRKLKAVLEQDVFSYADNWGQRLCDSLDKGFLSLKHSENQWFITEVDPGFPAAWIFLEESIGDSRVKEIQEIYTYDAANGGKGRSNIQWTKDETGFWVTVPKLARKGFWIIRLDKITVIKKMPASKK